MKHSNYLRLHYGISFAFKSAIASFFPSEVFKLYLQIIFYSFLYVWIIYSLSFLGAFVMQHATYKIYWENPLIDWLNPLGKHWCSTKTDRDGNHINGEGNHGFCGFCENTECGCDWCPPYSFIADYKGIRGWFSKRVTLLLHLTTFLSIRDFI